MLLPGKCQHSSGASFGIFARQMQSSAAYCYAMAAVLVQMRDLAHSPFEDFPESELPLSEDPLSEDPLSEDVDDEPSLAFFAASAPFL